MIQRWLFTATLLACVTTTAAAPVPEPSGTVPFLLARLQPADKLFEDAKFLARKFGKPEAADAFETKVFQQMGVGSIADTGIDTKRPSGLYVFLKPELAESTAVVMLPVANEKTILEFVGKFQVKAEKLEEGLYSVAIPEMPLPVFVRFANNYAYVTSMNKAAVSSSAILSPAKVFSANDASLLSVTVRPEQVPEPLRKMAMEQVIEYLKELEGDDDDEAAAKMAEIEKKQVERWMDAIVNGGKELTLRVNFDRISGELAFDFGMSAKPASKLAKELAAVKPGSSLFTKMVGDRGAINFLTNTRADAAYAKEIGEMFTKEGAHALAEMFDLDDTDEKAKAELNAMCKTLLPTIESGEFDFAVTLRPSGEKYCLLFGAHVKEGRKFEDGIRKLIATLPEDKRKTIKIDAKTIGEYKLHQIDEDDSSTLSEKIFGKSAIWIGFRDNAMVIGYGDSADKAVAEALAQVAPAPAPDFQIDVSVKKLKLFADAMFDSYGKVREIFGPEADRVRIISVETAAGDPWKARVSISLQMLVGIGLAFGDVADLMPVMPAVPAVPAVPPAPAPPPPPPPPAR